MSDKILASFETTIKKIDIRLRNENFKDPDQTERNIKDMKAILDILNKQVNDYEKLVSSAKGQEKEKLNMQYVSIREQYENRRKDVFKCEEKLMESQKIKDLLRSGNASRGDVSKAARAAIIETHKKTDYQGDLIDAIGKDLIDTNNNLNYVNIEVKKQGEQIENIHKNVLDTGASVKKADKTIGVMSRRTFCQKILLHILAILLFVAIITVFIIKRL